SGSGPAPTGSSGQTRRRSRRSAAAESRSTPSRPARPSASSLNSTRPERPPPFTSPARRRSPRPLTRRRPASSVVPVKSLHVDERPRARRTVRPVKSAGRVLDILELLAAEPQGLTLSRIADKLGIARSSAHGLVHTLLRRG